MNSVVSKGVASLQVLAKCQTDTVGQIITNAQSHLTMCGACHYRANRLVQQSIPEGRKTPTATYVRGPSGRFTADV
jgi:cytochrome c553